MIEAMKLWEKQPHEVREGFIEVTRNNSRDTTHVANALKFVEALTPALEKLTVKMG